MIENSNEIEGLAKDGITPADHFVYVILETGESLAEYRHRKQRVLLIRTFGAGILLGVGFACLGWVRMHSRGPGTTTTKF